MCGALEVERVHTPTLLLRHNARYGRVRRGYNVSEDEHREAMNRAFRQACARLELTGGNTMPVAELVAIRIVELVRTGDLILTGSTEATVSTF